LSPTETASAGTTLEWGGCASPSCDEAHGAHGAHGTGGPVDGVGGTAPAVLGVANIAKTAKTIASVAITRALRQSLRARRVVARAIVDSRRSR